MPIQSDHLSQEQFCALAEFRYQIRCFLAFSEAAAKTQGLEPHQHQLLLAVKGCPSGTLPTIGYLAERLQIRHHSAVELVNRMESRDLVRRVQGMADRRQVVIEMSPTGERLLQALSSEHHAELLKMGPTLVKSLQSLLKTAEVVA